MTPDTQTGPKHQILIAAAAGAVASYVGLLAIKLLHHDWIVDARGHPWVTDFLEFWVAGGSVLRGAPAAPYDGQLDHAAQVAAIGHPYAGVLGWHYPPLFLFVAGALALLPYAVSFIAWVCATAIIYVAAITKIAKRYEAGLLALAMPAAFGTFLIGQNGFLTTALVAGVLLTLEKRPVLSGLFLAALTYKPQFGLVFPLVLLIDGNWRALASAAFFTALLCALSWFAFGTAPFVAFFHHLPSAASTMLSAGAVGFDKVQSVYGLARWLGMGEQAAWIAHGSVALLAIASVLYLWRRDVPYALKAAALAAAVLVATPYSYMYDFPLLAIPFAFLYRAGAFDSVEIGAAVAINLAMLTFFWASLPIGPLLVAIVAVLLIRRAARIRSVAKLDIALQRA